jgi:maltooligosyltrehalose synthase
VACSRVTFTFTWDVLENGWYSIYITYTNLHGETEENKENHQRLPFRDKRCETNIRKKKVELVPLGIMRGHL